MPSAYFVTATLTDELNAGRAVAGIDINGDGLGDIVIGADTAGVESATGQVLVIYGQAAGFDSAALDLDDVALFDGTNGFVLDGPDGGEFGRSVQNVGDQNGDGLDDLAIVATGTGEVTIVFGRASTDTPFPAFVDLGAGFTGSGAEGFTISGFDAPIDTLFVTPAGQVMADANDDGVADIVLTSSGGGGADQVHVVFGAAMPADLDIADLDGTNGFTVTGLSLANNGGANAGQVGDLNNDGVGDILLGRPGPTNGIDSGDIVILLGSADAFDATFDIDDVLATDSITITGMDALNAPGTSVTGGFDINGDGIDDLVVSDAGDDGAGTNAGVVHVIFGDNGLSGTVDVDALDGTDGFTISGAAGDGLGTVVQSLGDVSGDGRDDLGVLDASGTLHIIYGIADTASFGADFDLSTLDGTNGYTIAGLFDETPETLSLTPLQSVFADQINDIAIGGTFITGEGETHVILGGDSNLAALDAADGVADGEIDFANIGAVEFVATDNTITIGGDDEGQLTEDQTSTSGTISITDTDDPTRTFANQMASGMFGGLVVNGAGNMWTYTFNTDAETLAVLQSLDEGDTIEDTVTVTADDGVSAQTITITINGLNDDAILSGDLANTLTEDDTQVTGSVSLTDVDADDSPSLANMTETTTNGILTFNAAGDGYTYRLTNPSLQSLNAGEDVVDNVAVTDSQGNSFNIAITITGVDEGTPIMGDNMDETFATGFGNDIINAEGGNDTVDAGAGDDTVNGGAGDDTITDPLGNNTIDGGADNDTITLLTGLNDVMGGTGNDYIRTGYQSDTVDGGAGNDVISADSGAIFLFGNDRVIGGAGDDVLAAGSGVDTFVFAPNEGRDTIGRFNESSVVIGMDPVLTGADFEAGIDKIELASFADVDAGNVLDFVTQGPNNSAVFSAEGTEITFHLVLASDLSANDFSFV